MPWLRFIHVSQTISHQRLLQPALDLDRSVRSTIKIKAKDGCASVGCANQPRNFAVTVNYLTLGLGAS